MVKKAVTKKKTAVKKPKVEKILVDNFVALQKVITNMSIKLDKLTNQLSELLELFEISAKSLAEKNMDLKKDHKDNQQIIQKMDDLFEQNKTIARGVALMHETGERVIRKPLNPQRPNPPGMQNPRFKQLPRK